jgi:hypothetical protein
MDYDEFTASLNKIYDYFQGKLPDAKVLRLWFDRVKSIPAGRPLSAIVSEIMDRDSIPKNMPKAFKTAWDTWMTANQDQIARQVQESKVECGYCDGSGFIFSKRLDQGTLYSFVSRCPRCRNWAGSMHESVCPSFTKEQLASNGFTIEG